MGFKNERGMMAIGVALMLIVVLPLFGGVLWQYSMAELKRVERTKQDIQASFLARAGAEAVLAAWLNPDSPQRPELPITFDTLYYQPDRQGGELFFSKTEPEKYAGVVDVVIQKEDYTVEDDEGETQSISASVIEAIARVGAVKRTARLITYPQRYGHDLAWYDWGVGEIKGPSPYKAGHELIIVEAENEGTPIYVGAGTLGTGSGSHIRDLAFEAAYLRFNSPLYLNKTLGNTVNIREGPRGQVNAVLRAEKIFLDGISIANISKFHDGERRKYGIILEVPDGGGLRGNDISGNNASGQIVSGATYGEVYFDKENQSFLDLFEWEREWKWTWLIGEWIYSVKHMKTHYFTDQVTDSGFYFRHGMKLDPLDIIDHLDENPANTMETYFNGLANSGYLVPIKPEHQITEDDLEGLNPYYWER